MRVRKPMYVSLRDEKENLGQKKHLSNCPLFRKLFFLCFFFIFFIICSYVLYFYFFDTKFVFVSSSQPLAVNLKKIIISLMIRCGFGQLQIRGMDQLQPYVSVACQRQNLCDRCPFHWATSGIHFFKNQPASFVFEVEY